MIQRCTNPKASGWDDYGARGITVCERWRKFENFLADMGPRPTGHSIERERVNEGYSPENCRWASQAEQSRNTRRTRNFTINGVTKCLYDWCNLSKKRYDRVRYLLSTGTPIEKALSITE